MSVKAGALNAVFTAYKRVLSPMLHSFGVGDCIFLPTCSDYAHQALLRHGFVRGSALALARIARCHPWGRGGHDPVP